MADEFNFNLKEPAEEFNFNLAPKKEPPKSRFEEPLVHFEKFLPEEDKKASPIKKAAMGAARGVAEMASDISSPRGLTTTAGLMLGEFIPGAGPLISKTAATYFTYGTARNIVESIPEAKKALTDGDWATLGKLVGQDVVNALFGYKGARELIKPSAVPADVRPRLAAAGTVAGQKVGEYEVKAAGLHKDQVTRQIGSNIIRANQGKHYRYIDSTVESVRNEHKRVEALPQTEKWAIVDDMEQAKDRASMRQRDPANQKIAEQMGKLYDEKWDEVIGLGIPGLDQHFYTTYAAHLWKDPTRAEGVIRDWYTKRPLTGTESFRRHRTHFTFEDGRKAGLVPITDNPIEMMLLKLNEVDKFVTGQHILRDLENEGMLKFLPPSHTLDTPAGPKVVPARIPDGWSKVDDKAFRLGPRGIKGDMIVPAPMARVLRAHLSTGISDYLRKQLDSPAADKVFQIARSYNAAANMVKVSWSAFHVGLETGQSWLNEVSLATRYLGNPEALKRYKGKSLAASMAWAPVRDWRLGKAMMEEYHHPKTHPVLKPFIDAYVKGGGRVRTVPLIKDELQYRSHLLDKFFDRWEESSKSMGTEIIPRMIRKSFEFTMQEYVPRMKMAAAARMAEFEYNRLGPGASETQLRDAFAKMVDSIDNRMGQINYDNWFISKAMKDIMFLNVGFLGWTRGTLMEGGGGVADLLRQPLRKRLGADTEYTHRAAWIMALPFTYGLLNGIYSYWMSGVRPSGKDYVFPRNGLINPDGTPQRDRLPFTSYIAEYYEWMTRPGITAMHKISNTIATAWELYHNTDIQGRHIQDPKANIPERIWQTAQYLVGRNQPIGFSTFAQEHERGEPITESLSRSVLGIRRAPAYTMRTAAQNMILDNSPIEMKAISEEKFEHKETGRKLLEGIRAGRMTMADARQAFHDKKIYAKELQTIGRATRTPPWAPAGIWGKRFIALDPDVAMTIFRIATVEEKQHMRFLMNHHIGKLMRQGKTEDAHHMQDEVRKELRNIGPPTPPPPQTAAEFNFNLGQ